ncbi:MAG: DUF4105 domain-containing protein, partial [Pseudomonadales bacterium]|nr:DUF4105 domain-containing protein [Pseudomonadales bacterium]
MSWNKPQRTRVAARTIRRGSLLPLYPSFGLSTLSYRGIFFLLLVICSFSVASDEHRSPANIIGSAHSMDLQHSPTWLGLLLFEDETATSKIVSESFFLASSGNVDAGAELDEAISALFTYPVKGDEDHPVCRFPARYIWLDRKLGLPEVRRVLADCDGYRKWNRQGGISSVSIVFSTGYLKNPASYYGHILIKFNSNEDIPLMDASLDHGAILNKDDSLPVYIFKGLTGGYEAGFTHSVFYQKSHNYGEIELRDLWEYQLSLTEAERELLIAHAWELIGNKTTYYFINENCATAVADLLEVVLNEKLRRPGFPWMVPPTIFQSLHKMDQTSRPVIADVKLIPSRQTRFAARYNALTEPEKISLQEMIKQSSSADRLAIREDSSQRVLATLLDYYRLRTLQFPDDETYDRKVQDTLK